LSTREAISLHTESMRADLNTKLDWLAAAMNTLAGGIDGLRRTIEF
jgi:hypothetical protein